MSVNYGVLRGRVAIFKREDDFSTPHLQIKIVDDASQAWRAAVNVLSGDQSLVIFHRADPLQNHPILATLPQVASGFTLLPKTARVVSKALDYFRAPLFDWPTGVAIPQSGPGSDDDLQDALVAYLKQLQDHNGELFMFGSKFPEPGQPPAPRPIDKEFQTMQGIHDVHMNQGNPSPGPFAKDNGVFQDGGLIMKFGGRYVGLFLRFQSQWLPTDNATGQRTPKARPIPAGGIPDVDPGTDPSSVTHPAVYIERALVNPAGGDVGHEVIVLGNTTTRVMDLTGWSIVDKNNNSETLQGVVLPPGESHNVMLSGTGIQLGNKGGTIALKNQAGDLVHAVSYSKDDAGLEDIYIRFNT